ncbi:RagB/SusD family nutrient uptake outer membrane protein [Flavobacterium sp. LHD-80]|uniref:RagB/SusD family nutrient uptake outer membrane protein n=1 Tax=Flavobacterium sp. LHD-80 TaxID=3071411 RepID=UPI0027E18966|nr:RagB/SusD family nutrient uptake outer membrane protein [Flavobacterium sp. LHD-80]MDQ6469722.1 RagB/SusD family nutrient uptake outer membrane protein [Flavobacterium sp. LHD-80]
MNYLKYITIIILIFSLQSCSDFLEQEPGTQTSIDELLQNKEGVLKALKGLYVEVEANVRSERFAVYSDLQGGNIKFTPTSSGSSRGQITPALNIREVYSFEDTADNSNFKSFYDASYDIINQANLILEYTPTLTDATEAEKNQIKAEALTIRAYAHFLLSQIYSQNYSYTTDASHLGIVYSRESIKTGIKYPKRETLAATYSFIIEDLKTAISNYSDASLMTGPSYSYFNRNNAKALLARVYLYKKDWTNAYETANDVITNSGITLVNTSNFVTQWTQPDLPISEALLEFSVPKDLENTVSSSMSSYFGVTENNYAKYVASNDLYNLYENTDLRKQLFIGTNLSTLVNGVLVPVNYNFTRKFQDNAGYVAFRISEMYLIRAEAALENNKPDLAMADVNTIRARAKASLLTNTTNLKEDILLERRKELCFEGHLFFDLARNHKGITRNDGCISTVCSLTYPSLKYVLPIPTFNINLNENLQQNESY